MLLDVSRLVGQTALAPDQPIYRDCLAGLSSQRDGQLQLMTDRG
jgi:hypothetical protein